MSWINRILVPVDLSACSIAALRYGVFLSEHSGADLIVMHVETSGPAHVANATHVNTVDSAAASLDRQRYKRVIYELLGSVSGRAAQTATVLFGRGEPVDMVVRTAREQQADLIVMGRHGDGCSDASHLGNVTRAVAERAPCGVVPVHEARRRGSAFALSVMGANDPNTSRDARPPWASVRPMIRRDRFTPRTDTPMPPIRHLWRRDPHPPGPTRPQT